MELDKANLLVIIISFIFGSALFVITIIAGFYGTLFVWNSWNG